MASRATAYRPVIEHDRRAAPRPTVQVHHATIAGTGGEVAAELIDVSIYGCRVSAAVGPEVDGPVRVGLDGNPPVAARVVWNREGVLGCRFDQPITASLLRSLTIRVVED